MHLLSVLGYDDKDRIIRQQSMKGQMQEAGPILNEDTVISDLSQINV